MNPSNDDASDRLSEQVEHPTSDETPETRPEPPVRGGSALGAFALSLALVAAALAGYAVWRIMLIERGDDNALTELNQRLDALETRLTENERRAARNNELASTLRDQSSENERLRERMREDLLALADRSARAEALLADVTREQRGTRAQLALTDAGLMLAQADARLRLFGDRHSSGTALELAEAALADAGADQADLRAAVADARAALAADQRPSVSALLAELDAVADALDKLTARTADDAAPTAATDHRGWWARQFDWFDHLITIRRETEPETDTVAPTKYSVRQALMRARLAALEQNEAALSQALETARSALRACCDAEAAAPVLTRLDRLIAIDWQAAQPDLHALRERLNSRTIIERMPDPIPEPLPEPMPDAMNNDDHAPAEEDAA